MTLHCCSDLHGYATDSGAFVLVPHNFGVAVFGEPIIILTPHFNKRSAQHIPGRFETTVK